MAKENNAWIWIIIIIVFLLLFFSFKTPEQELSVQPTDKLAEPTGKICSDYPDFTGTPRVGEPCIDTLDCENHPPENYISGYLNCVEGKCEFNC
jgi:hypothetical protein